MKTKEAQEVKIFAHILLVVVHSLPIHSYPRQSVVLLDRNLAALSLKGVALQPISLQKIITTHLYSGAHNLTYIKTTCQSLSLFLETLVVKTISILTNRPWIRPKVSVTYSTNLT